MADGNYGERVINIDLTVVGARIIRPAPQVVKIAAIRVNGVAGAGAGDIVLRKESASGSIVFKLNAPNGSSHDGTMTLTDPGDLGFNGLYMDALATAWTAGAHMEIYTR